MLDGKWVLEGLIGEGGMGSVWQARDLELDRMVAVKMLSPALAQSPEFVARFEREARTMAKLEHPNLIPIYAVARKEGVPFLVMKLLEGRPLDLHTQSKGGLSRDEVLSIARQACSALSFIHSRGLVHRDLKPANLFVGTDGHLTVLDLGLVRPSKADGLTRAGLALGTPGYMAPEQIVDAHDLDQRADLYALGVILFELFTGQHPYRGNSEFELMLAHRNAPVPDASRVVPKVTPAVAQVLARALAKTREERFSSAEELLNALEAAVCSPLAAAPPAPAPRRRAVLIGASVIALSAVAGLGWLALGPSAAGPPLPAPPAPSPIAVVAEPVPTTPAPHSPPVPAKVVPASTAVRVDSALVDAPPPVEPSAPPPRSPEETARGAAPESKRAGASSKRQPVPARREREGKPAAEPAGAERPSSPGSTQANAAGVPSVLIVHVTPWGKIFVDGRELPSANGMDAVTELPSGRHQLRVVHPALGERAESIALPAGETVERKIDLRPRR